MPNSIRNQIEGAVSRITSDKVMTEVVLETPVGPLTAIVTTASVKTMKLKRGKVVTALIKATSVALKDCDCGKH